MNSLCMLAPYDLNKTGGVERYIQSFAKAASGMLKKVDVYTINPGEIEGVGVYKLYDWDDKKYDLCMSHALFGAGVFPKAKVYLHTFHGTILGNLLVRPWLWIHPKFIKWLVMEVASLREKDGIIAVSEWAQREVKLMGYKGPIIRVPSGGGFENEEFRFAGEKPKGKLKCLFAGRKDDKVKRFPMIERGVRLCLEKTPNLELHVFGGDKTSSFDGIFFHGDTPYEELLSKLGEFHVQINASYYEGFSLSLSEGIFQGGLITLATRRGGNIHCLQNGKTGFYFESSEELASYLCVLADQEVTREKMLQSIREIHDIYSWEKVVQEVLKFAKTLEN